MGVLSRFIELVYPPRCIGCGEFLSAHAHDTGRESSSLCGRCFADLRKISPPLCPVCGRPFVSRSIESHVCGECAERPPFYESRSAPYLYEGALRKAIHHFKYQGKSGYAPFLGQLLADFALARVGKRQDSITVPVPLHPKRLRERGYNQSLLLAKPVSVALQIPLDYLSLVRKRWSPPQTGLGKRQRRKNVTKAFDVVNNERVKGKRVLLIDDVATTGHTLNECSRALRRAGCKSVSCLVLASTGSW